MRTGIQPFSNKCRLVVAVEIRDIGNHADIQAFVFDRRTGRQAAYGLFEKRGVVQRAVVRQVFHFSAVVVKLETVVVLNMVLIFCFWGVE